MQRAQLVVGIMLMVAGASTYAMATGVPEVAVGSAGSAIALVSGMLMVIRGRRKK
jgi:hypothetical protein